MAINFWSLVRRVIWPHDLLVNRLWEINWLICNIYLIGHCILEKYWLLLWCKKLLSATALSQLSLWCSSILSTNRFLFQIIGILLKLITAHSHSLWLLRWWRRFTERWGGFLSPVRLSIIVIRGDSAPSRWSRCRSNADSTEKVVFRLLGNYNLARAAATNVLIVILSVSGYMGHPAMLFHRLFRRFASFFNSCSWSWQRLTLLDQDCFIELYHGLLCKSKQVGLFVEFPL